MNIKIDEQAGTAVLEPTGDLVVGISTCPFRDLIKDLLGRNINHIVVDMINVKFINSVCIAALVSGFTSVRNAGGELKLANTNERVKTILAVTRLDSIFHIYDNLENAVDSFG